MQTMYNGLVNSPETTTTNNISNSDTIIYLLDPSRVPDELPNLMTLGTGTNAETVKVTAIDGSAITVERGFQGTPAAWNAGTIIARNFTEYDYNALKENILELDADKEELIKDATAKTTPVDADTMPLSDSAASGATKKITWANIKAALETFFDTLYVTLTSVANNLTTTAAGYVLDARQGKVLGDLISNLSQKTTNRFLADVSTITTGDTTTITTGFQPKKITAFSSFAGQVLYSHAIQYGVDKGITCNQYLSGVVNTAYDSYATFICVAPDGSNSIVGKITSITPTGLVITWTKTGTIVGTLIAEILSEGV